MTTPISRRSKTRQDVHIVPVAREVDRVVLPFLPREGHPPTLHAHRIILLVPAAAQAKRIAAKVEKALSVAATVERYDLATDVDRPTAGFQGILHQISWLCARELEQGNRVHINLSSGTKLVAFAAGLAGMAHLRSGSGSIYYVQPSGYSLSEADFEEHGPTRGVMDVEELQLMPLFLPEPLQLRVLNFLKYQPDSRTSYRDLIDFLAQVPGSDFAHAPATSRPRVRNWNNSTTTRMVRTILTPLQGQGLVEILDQGRQKVVHLTSRGLLYSSIAGLDRDRLKDPLKPSSSTIST